jgi:hypothetical protein
MRATESISSGAMLGAAIIMIGLAIIVRAPVRQVVKLEA